MDAAAWDTRYRSSELVWGLEPNQFLVDEVAGLTPLPEARALDAAAGEGRNALWLARQGWKVTAVDFSAAGLERGGRLAGDSGFEVEWVHADLTTWEAPEGVFALVVVLYLQLPAHQRRAAHRHLGDALAPGGTLLVIGHDRTNLTDGFGGPQDATVLLDPEEVAGDFGHLSIEVAEQRVRPVTTDAGERHAIDTVVRLRRPSA